MRIGIDVRYLSHGLVGGIHTYLKNIVPELLALGSEHEFVLYADTKRPFEIAPLPSHATLKLLPYRNAASSVYNDLFMRNQMTGDRLDVLHFPASYGFGPSGVPLVITLQDEINVLPLKDIIRSHRKNARTIASMTYLHNVTTRALPKADRVITVSEYSKRQILEYSPIPAERIVVIPHACPKDIVYIQDEAELDEVRGRLSLKRPIILADAFKNPGVIVRAWRRLAPALRDSHEIVYFSRSPEVLPVVHEAVEAGYAKLMVRPARRDLSALFSMARTFVFPSWIEGFGIPLVEAMNCGTPIIASDRGSIPEVVGDAGIIIDAEDDAALAEHLTRLLEQPAAREHLRQLGFARLQRYRWPAIIQQMFETYQGAISSARGGAGG